jgi:hypothetical protein
MRGLFLITTLCSLTGLIPCIYGLFKIKRINKIYYLFILLVSFGCLIEILARIFVILNELNLSRILINIYILFEGVIFLIIFKKWQTIYRKSILYICSSLLLLVWLFDNFIISSITQINSIYNTFYSILIVQFAIKLFQQSNFKNLTSLFKDPYFIISCTLILNYSYRAVFESLYLFKLEFSNNFFLNAFFILITLNVFSNCTYTYAIYYMKQRKKLTSFYLL